MKSVFSAETAILVHFKSVGAVLLVFHSVVVALFAFGASECNFYSFTVSSHLRHLHFGIFELRDGLSGNHPALRPPSAYRGLIQGPFRGAKIKPSRRGKGMLSQVDGIVKHFFIFCVIFYIIGTLFDNSAGR